VGPAWATLQFRDHLLKVIIKSKKKEEEIQTLYKSLFERGFRTASIYQHVKLTQTFSFSGIWLYLHVDGIKISPQLLKVTFPFENLQMIF